MDGTAFGTRPGSQVLGPVVVGSDGSGHTARAVLRSAREAASPPCAVPPAPDRLRNAEPETASVVGDDGDRRGRVVDHSMRGGADANTPQ